ncbi:MAG: GTPase [Maribacter sp.]|nr:GTPase [Maribacter sp.]
MKDPAIQKLIFVYNANTGFANSLLDAVHKILSPATYECPLCEITFGAFTEKRIWKKFRQKSTVPMEFLHKNEFKKQYASKFGYKFTFPIVLIEIGNGLEVFIKTEELNAMNRPESLIEMILDRIGFTALDS